MKQLLHADFYNALGLFASTSGVWVAKAALYTPAPPLWIDVLHGGGGGVLGAAVMIYCMPRLRRGRTPGDLFFLVLFIAMLAGLASAFTAALILIRLDLMYLWGEVAIAMGGAFAAMGGVLVFPIIAKLTGWVSRHVDMIADSLWRRFGGRK